MLLNVNFVTFHDVAKTVRNLVSEILFRLLVLLGHELSVKFGVLLIEKLARLLNLRKIGLVWLLIFTNVAFHDLSDIDESLMGFSLSVNDIQSSLIILGNSVLKLSSKSTLGLTKVPKSLKVTLVLVEFRSENQVALVCHVVDLLIHLCLDFILFSNLLSKLIVLVVSSIDELIEFLFKLFSSGLSLQQLELIALHFFIL